MNEDSILKDTNKIPEARSYYFIFCLMLTIQLGAVNIGYVLTYMSLSFDTIFEVLHIAKEDETYIMSLMNGVMPVGSLVGCILARYLMKWLTNKNCLYLADALSIPSLITLIPEFYSMMAFRFLLGIANGINSVIMPIQVKHLCPEKHLIQFSMFIGFYSSAGLLIGQVMGCGYLNYSGEGSHWWQVVFAFPPFLALIRSFMIYMYFDFENPNQLCSMGKIPEAKLVIAKLYSQECVDQIYEQIHEVTTKQSDLQMPLRRIFTEARHRRTLIIGILSNLVQQWCGAFAVFYYGAQINEQLANGNLTKVTAYTIAIGMCLFFPQFLNIPLTSKYGVKLTLVWGSFIMALLNIVVAVFSSLEPSDINLIITLVFMLAQVVCFGIILQPNTWSITSQLNETDGNWMSMVFRWCFQIILVVTFPYQIAGYGIEGSFIIFAIVCVSFGVFAIFKIKDYRGLSQNQIEKCYAVPTPKKVKQMELINS